MNREIKYLIEDIRLHTENEEVSDTTGISDQEFLRFLNDAQDRLHGKINHQHPSVFISEQDYAIVPGQESYSLPSDIFIGNMVVKVWYSSSGKEEDYYPLKPEGLAKRQSGTLADPIWYIRSAGKILISAVPNKTGAKLRVRYVRAIRRLDLKRGSVASATLDTGTNTITALSLDVSTDEVDSAALDKQRYITVVDLNGNVKMRNIEVDSIDGSTGIVTVTAGFTFEDGETISAGDTICSGANHSTHSEFPISLERYLIAYLDWKIFKRDSSADSQEAFAELAEMEQEIIESYAEPDHDVRLIPDINQDEWWSW